jgi:hypothetical protein
MAELSDVDAAKLERAAKLALIAVAVAAVVLLIDYRLKAFIIDKGQEAMRLLARAEELAVEAREHGAGTANRHRAADSAGVGGGHGVGDDAAAGAVLAESANGFVRPPGVRPAGQGGGPGGDGAGTVGA